MSKERIQPSPHLVPSEPPQQLPSLPGRYTNAEIIGQGNMGLVASAYDKILERKVAIKVLLREEACNQTEQERLKLEAKALATLNHQNIVKILSWEFGNGSQPYCVMELLEGVSLVSEIGNGKSITPTRFSEIFIPIVAGLAHAHECGVVHRDLKPSNIFLAQTHGALCPKIIDFGIARIAQEQGSTQSALTKTGALLGSPSYMSPEQCKGKAANHLSDIYSLACIMFEALTGRPPHEGDTAMEVMYKHFTKPAPSLELRATSSNLKLLGRLIDRCLSIDSTRRPQSAQEIEDELKSIFEERVDTGKMFGQHNAGRNKQTHLLLAGSLFFVLITILAFALASRIQHLQLQNAQLKEAEKQRTNQDSLMANEIARRKTGFTRARSKEELDYEGSKLAALFLQKATFLEKSSDFAAEEKTLQEGLASMPPENIGHQCLRIALGNCKLAQRNFSEVANQLAQIGPIESKYVRTRADFQLLKSNLLIAQRQYKQAAPQLRETIELFNQWDTICDAKLQNTPVFKDFRPKRKSAYIQSAFSELNKADLSSAADKIDALPLINEFIAYYGAQDSDHVQDPIKKARKLLQELPECPDALRKTTETLIAKYSHPV